MPPSDHILLPRRVLLLARYLNPGGVTTHLATLALGLQECGVEVAILSRGKIGDHPRSPDWFEQQGIPHLAVPFPSHGTMFSTLRDTLHAIPVFLQTIRSFQPDLIHVHFRAVSMYAQLAFWRWQIPFVTTLHRKRIPASLRYRLLSFWGQAAIGVSRAACRSLQEDFDLAHDKVYQIPNGADIHYFHPPTPSEQQEARTCLQVASQAPVVAMVASLYPIKRHEVLIQALTLLKQRGIRTIALFAGSGNAAPLQHLASVHDLTDQIRFLGHTDVRQVLWCADAFVLPSLEEGFPLSVVEAMLCGVVPILTPASGADMQIRQGKTGFLIPFDDALALADSLEEILSDATRRKRMGTAIRYAAVEKFSAQQMVHQTLAVYSHALTR